MQSGLDLWKINQRKKMTESMGQMEELSLKLYPLSTNILIFYFTRFFFILYHWWKISNFHVGLCISLIF